MTPQIRAVRASKWYGAVAALSDVSFDGWAVVELDSVPDNARTPKEAGAVNKKFLEGLGFDVSVR